MRAETWTPPQNLDPSGRLRVQCGSGEQRRNERRTPPDAPTQMPVAQAPVITSTTSSNTGYAFLPCCCGGDAVHR